jgi:hypothetical protein
MAVRTNAIKKLPSENQEKKRLMNSAESISTPKQWSVLTIQELDMQEELPGERVASWSAPSWNVHRWKPTKTDIDIRNGK